MWAGTREFLKRAQFGCVKNRTHSELWSVVCRAGEQDGSEDACVPEECRSDGLAVGGLSNYHRVAVLAATTWRFGLQLGDCEVVRFLGIDDNPFKIA